METAAPESTRAGKRGPAEIKMRGHPSIDDKVYLMLVGVVRSIMSDSSASDCGTSVEVSMESSHCPPRWEGAPSLNRRWIRM